jgi:hypothetical protein
VIIIFSLFPGRYIIFLIPVTLCQSVVLNLLPFFFICCRNHFQFLPCFSSLFAAKSLSIQTLSFFFFWHRNVDSKPIILLYLPQKSMAIFTVLFFFICRRKHCRFYSYFSSLFAAEIFVDSNLIFLLFLRRKSFSIRTVFFTFICPGNPNLIVQHRCRGCLFFYCTTRAASP